MSLGELACVRCLAVVDLRLQDGGGGGLSGLVGGDGNPYPWSKVSWFETGLMSQANWQAKWIGSVRGMARWSWRGPVRGLRANATLVGAASTVNGKLVFLLK